MDLPPFKDDDRTVMFRVGEPDAEGGVAQVSIPLSDADLPAGNHR